MSRFLAFALFVLSALPLSAEMAPRDGWSVIPTQMSFDELSKAVPAAVKANGMIVVTQAGPTKAAAARGTTIPGNRVFGVFRNDFAVQILSLSTAAMIEAPIRLYVTENTDKTATLSYKLPSHVLSPYLSDAPQDLSTIANELDALFAAIARQATAP